MELKTLVLHSFKGCLDSALRTGGDVEVWGDNGTGKTTLFDAFTWLLFGKDSLNRADFEIKTLDAKGNAIPGLDHEVEGTLGLDGKVLTLRKVYSENWTKKRGSATKEFTGHSIDHFVDGVPVKKGEYDARIADIVDESTFKLLTNPRYFNEILTWQKRRELLLGVCGDISDADVITSDSKLKSLPAILGGRSLDDHKAVIKARRAELNKELEKIPVRISEVQRGLPETTEAAANELPDLRRRRSEESALILRMESGGEVAEKVKELREVEAELLKIQQGYWIETANKVQLAKVELRKLEDFASSLGISIGQNQKQIEGNLAEVQSLDKKLTLLREDWEKISKEGKFTFEESDTCPTCGQALPAEQVKAAREKALAGYNVGKASRLEGISNEGKMAKLKAESFREQSAEIEQLITESHAKLAEVEGRVAGAQAVITSLEKQEADSTKDETYAKKQLQKECIEERIELLRIEGAEAVETVRLELGQIDEQINEIEHTLAQVEQRKSGLKRIEELKVEERTLAGEYERLEGELYLAEQFIRTKVRILEDKINSRFTLARFKLFNVLVNGGIEECCETTYAGIPYGSGLNNGMRLNIGLDIIDTLSRHYGLTAPIWIDNAEAVTALLPTEGQQIRLYVSEADKTLRILNK